MENQSGENLQQPSELEKKSDAGSSDSTGPISPSVKGASNAGPSEPIPTNSNSSEAHAHAEAVAAELHDKLGAKTEVVKGVPVVDVPAVEEPEAQVDVEEHRKMQAERTMQDLNPHLAAPPSKPHEEPKKAVAGGPTQPSRDEDRYDSLGNEKFAEGDSKLVGPRGAHVSPEHLSEEEKAESEKNRQEREHRGMSSTAAIDSAGNSKHIFRHEPQGNDRHGARLPDRNTGELVEEAPKHVGPRGLGVPKDTFHRG